MIRSPNRSRIQSWLRKLCKKFASGAIYLCYNKIKSAQFCLSFFITLTQRNLISYIFLHLLSTFTMVASRDLFFSVVYFQKYKVQCWFYSLDISSKSRTVLGKEWKFTTSSFNQADDFVIKPKYVVQVSNNSVNYQIKRAFVYTIESLSR